jgi:hypothetical protein
MKLQYTKMTLKMFHFQTYKCMFLFWLVWDVWHFNFPSWFAVLLATSNARGTHWIHWTITKLPRAHESLNKPLFLSCTCTCSCIFLKSYTIFSSGKPVPNWVACGIFCLVEPGTKYRPFWFCYEACKVFFAFIASSDGKNLNFSCKSHYITLLIKISKILIKY